MRIRQTRAMAEVDKLRRYLIVTDHAFDDQQLAATVQPSLAAGPCQFYLLVLASPAGTKDRVLWGALSGSSASAPNPGPAAEQGVGSGPRTTRLHLGSPGKAGRRRGWGDGRATSAAGDLGLPRSDGQG
jgi:hypothetical protein